MVAISADGSPIKSWQPRSVFSITACLNFVASSGMPRSYLSMTGSSRKKCGDQGALRAASTD
jgi:hypothetical protein